MNALKAIVKSAQPEKDQFKQLWTKLNQMNQDLLSMQIQNEKTKEKEQQNEQINEE